MKIEASFVLSAASASDLPDDRLAEIALVGRSNVGKSSLINALVRQRLARTSAAPGKTRLANIYRVARGGGQPLYLVDLPGYGYARGGRDAATGFEALTRGFFGREGRGKRERRDGPGFPAYSAAPAHPGPPAPIGALLLVDSRHPGLEHDLAAWRWLQSTVERGALVATKIDKLASGQRIRALRELESVFEHPVLPVSAVTGEGLDELWILIDSLGNNPSKPNRSNQPRSTRSRQPKAAPPPRTKALPPKR